MRINLTIKTILTGLIYTWLNVYSAQASQAFTPGVVGNMTSIGSDTLSSVMTGWATEFNRLYPQAKIQIQITGSSAAPIAITAGTASLGPMSRPLKPSERQSFINRFGYEPTMVTVAIDAIGVFVQENNPLQNLSMEQLDRLFSATRYCTFDQPIRYWDELLDESEYSRSEFSRLSNFPIQLYGRNSASGTYSYFKQKSLCHGDYLNTVKQLPSSASIIHKVANRMGAIGYASLGFTFSGVKALSIGNKGRQVEVNAKTIQSGKYPLARELYLLVNQSPDKSLAPGVAQFLRYVLSEPGQQIVRQSGYFPISSERQQEQLNKLFKKSEVDLRVNTQ